MAEDDRDRRVPRAPPQAVSAQIAPPIDSWKADPTPQPQTVPEALERVGRRQKQTQETQLNTLDRVDSLAARIGRLDFRVDGLAATAAHTAGVVAGMDGKVDLLTDLVQTALEAQSEISVARVTAAVELAAAAETAAVAVRKTAEIAAVEVKKTAEIAVIDEAKGVRDHRRQRALKILAIFGPPIAAAITLLTGRC